MTADIKITADPVSNAICKFTVDRPVYPDSSFYFASKERAKGSHLAERLFEIPTVRTVLISHDRVVVNKAEWKSGRPSVGRSARRFGHTWRPTCLLSLKSFEQPFRQPR